MPESKKWNLARLFLFPLLVLAALPAFGQDDEDEEDPPEAIPGIVAELTDSRGNTFERIDERISHVWNEEHPDTRLKDDQYQVKWTGLLETVVDGEYRFHFHLAGKVNLKINGQSVLNSTVPKPEWVTTEPIELNWGEQSIEVTFEKTGPEARIGFYWEGPDFELEPVAAHWLSHSPENSPENHFERGKFLVRALRCNACHQIPTDNLPIQAPDLVNLQGHISEHWIVDWLTQKPEEDPESEDELISRRMPHFSFSNEEAEAITSYLLSQSKPSQIQSSKLEGDPEKGHHQFLIRGCIACHRVNELGTSGLFGGGDLTRIAEKRPAGFFKPWLTDPEKINAHHRMPVFTLEKSDMKNIPAYLASLKKEDSPEEKLNHTPEKIALGKELVTKHKCANCHQLNDTGLSPAEKTVLSSGSNWKTGCSGAPSDPKKHPVYSLAVEQQKAIELFITEASKTPSLSEEKPDGQFVLKEKNCIGCHSRGNELGMAGLLQDILEEDFSVGHSLPYLKPPSLDSVGDKLHDKVLKKAILSERDIRRPWLYVRMPKFKLTQEESDAIVDYLVSVDRIPPVPKEMPEIEKSKMDVAGKRLVTSDGFGCTSCHNIGDLKVKNVSPSAIGPSLTMIGNDVREQWFYRWLRNPIRISPRMEMPAIKTPIRGVLEDNIHLQTASVWNIINQPGFTPPKADAIRVLRQYNDPENPRQAEILIDNIEINQGKQNFKFVKPLLMALPNRHNILFDLEKNRLTNWTLGDAAHQRTRRKYWYWENAASPVLPVVPNQRDPETGLVLNNQIIPPAIDPDFPPEFEYVQKTQKGIEFHIHLPFDLPSSGKTNLKVTQLFEPFQEEKISGFERTIQFEEVPKNSSIQFQTLPGRKPQLSEDRKTVSTDHTRVDLLTDQFTFAQAENGTILIDPGQKKTVLFKLKYSTDLPTDRYLKVPPEPWKLTQEELIVVPGFQATRLPLMEEIMPTAISWKENGKLIFATLKGRLWEATDTNQDGIEDQLKLLQDGFSAPFGLNATRDEKGNSVIDITDKTALLRLIDTNKDGIPDRTETAASGWGHNFDYHGWVLGLPQDEEGNYYASVTNRNGPLKHLRGRVMKLTRFEPEDPDSTRRYQVKPIAIGFRFPVGIARNKKGELFVTDNQGQYNPYNEINFVEKGNHYGFFNLESMEDTPELKKMKKHGPAVGVPHPWMRSINGICFLETPEEVLSETGKPLFGPFEGHLLGSECTTRQLARISFERVDGVLQGAAYPLTIKPPRGATPLLRPLVSQVNPHNGDIYVGSLRDSAWGAGRNVGELVRLRFTGEIPTGIAEMRMIKDGFELEFTHPIDSKKAVKKSNYNLISYKRIPTPAYGSPDSDKRTEKIQSLQVSADGKLVTIKLEKIRKGYVYELKLRKLIDSNELFHPAEAYYTSGPLQ